MVRAKFVVDSIEASHSRRMIDPNGGYGADNMHDVEVRTVKLRPVYSDDPGHENHTFWEATPSGVIELGVINPEAWQVFELGKEFYVDFAPAPEK